MSVLKSLEVFVKVAEVGSFIKAANHLDISAVMVGKHIAMLEKQLNTILIERNTRNQHLTEAGCIFYERCKTVLTSVQQAFQISEELSVEPSGLLSISAPQSFGSYVIAPIAAKFQKEYPKIKMNLNLTNQKINLLDGEFDIAIRIGDIATDTIICQYLCDYEMVLAASQQYLNSFGCPKNLEDLSHHQLLAHEITHAIDEETYPDLISLKSWAQWSTFICNDGHALKLAALNGNGIILQPSILLKDALISGELVKIFENLRLPKKPVNILYTTNGKKITKISIFIDYLKKHIHQYI